MIEINLLPGAGKKSRGGGTSFSVGTFFSDAMARVKDPYLLSAVGSVGLAAVVVGLLHVAQAAKSSDLTEREQRAVQDSTRFTAVLRERQRAVAQRDSVQRQLEIIKSIDNDRFVWPHIMDEVSRALPPYTWLKTISQLSTTAPPSGTTQPQPQPQQKAPATDTTKRDPSPVAEAVRFRIVGHTVDIQALTRFMKLLETSPFVQNVQLARSELVQVEGKEVTEFQLDAEYERPDPSEIRTTPVLLSVR